VACQGAAAISLGGRFGLRKSALPETTKHYFMAALTYPDELIRTVMRTSKRIAMVGASDNPSRPSYIVFKYLKERGYEVFPVNPGRVGAQLLGVPFYGSLMDVPAPIDMVDIFRGAEAAPGIVAEALALPERPKVIWMQLSVISEEARALAEAEGLTVIMDRCPKIEYGRLSGEISWGGIASGQISAKRPRLAGSGFQKLKLDRSGDQ